jgi:hypothetical protein
MTRLGADGMPAWAVAILFWRKVQQVESRGVPGSARRTTTFAQPE